MKAPQRLLSKIIALPVCLISASVSFASTQLSEQACMPDSQLKTIYVNGEIATSGDGQSWATAFNNLHDAFELAESTSHGEQIWVSQGTYTNHETSYRLPNNVYLIGGFRGTEQRLQSLTRTPDKTERHKTKLVSALKNSPLMFTSDNSNIALYNLHITGGRANGHLSEDALNASNQVRGSGLFAVDSHVTICNSAFTNNEAKKFGGAVFVEGGALSIINSAFSHNQTVRSKTDVHDSLAEADTDGGAVAAHNTHQVTIHNSVFEKNTAGDDGGAVAVRRSNVTVSHSHFDKNRAIGFSVPFTQPTITDDFVTSFGGGLAIHNEFDPTNPADQTKQVVIADTRFTNNRSSIGAGAFVLGNPGSETRITRATFKNNGGNGIPHDAPNTNIDGIEFGNGAAGLLLTGTRQGDRATDANGNFIRPLHQAYINNALFKNNESSYSGSLVMISLNTEINDSVFKNNVARARGGAIWNQNFFALFDQFAGLAPDFGSTIINNSLFSGNTSLGQLETGQADVFPGIMKNEEQTYGGGAISNDLAGRLTINNSQFFNNTSVNGDGGAIHNATTPITFFGMIGAPITYPSTLTVNGSAFINNQTSMNGSGGAIATGGNEFNGVLLGADGTDLAAVSEGSTSTVNHSVFFKNSSVNDGGAFANWNGSSLSINQSWIINNKTAGNGTAISSVGHEDNLASMHLESNIIKGKNNQTQALIYQVNTQ
ncbi:hypothetical protein [Litoribacillus peritrichatus]|uniref:Uncharacterized protein n=1 Tax=Litoribacillus peritrichatus TaxID=718191 RepID=A0ABP7MCF3_9GAMM